MDSDFGSWPVRISTMTLFLFPCFQSDEDAMDCISSLASPGSIWITCCCKLCRFKIFSVAFILLQAWLKVLLMNYKSWHLPVYSCLLHPQTANPVSLLSENGWTGIRPSLLWHQDFETLFPKEFSWCQIWLLLGTWVLCVFISLCHCCSNHAYLWWF